jgi:hypothetical protein
MKQIYFTFKNSFGQSMRSVNDVHIKISLSQIKFRTNHLKRKNFFLSLKKNHYNTENCGREKYNQMTKINYHRKIGHPEQPKLQTQPDTTTTRSPGRGGRGGK